MLNKKYDAIIVDNQFHRIIGYDNGKLLLQNTSTLRVSTIGRKKLRQIMKAG